MPSIKPNKDMLKEKQKIAAEKIKEASSAVSDKAATKIKHTTWLIRDKTQDKVDMAKRLKRGYSDAYLWNFGRSLLDRFADIADFLAQQSFVDCDDGWHKQLRECSDAFRAYPFAYDNLITPSFEHNDIEKINKIMVQADKSFMEHWTWFINNVIIDLKYKPVLPAWYTAEKANCLPVKARTLIEQVSGKITYKDIEELPYGEMTLVTDIIYRWIRDIHGNPDKYASSEHQLQTRNDDWGKHQSFTVSFFVKGNFCDTVENDLIRPKNREDIGLDFCAWVEDLHQVCVVFNAAQEWYGAPEENDSNYENGARYCDMMRSLNEKMATDYEKLLNTNIMNCWLWIGHNILALWD